MIHRRKYKENMRLSAQKVRKVIKKNAGQRDKYYLFDRENKREKMKD